MRKLNLRIVAFWLILVFSQKGGAQLWLHICLHTRPPSQNRPVPSLSQQGQPPCSCLDDLMMPLEPAPSFQLFAPDKDYIVYLASWPSSVLSLARHYPSLRGPPVAA